MEIEPVKKYTHTLLCPPDKSITIRAVIMNALFGSGKSTITNPLISLDTRSAVACAERLGAKIETTDGKIFIDPVKIPKSSTLDCGNSATVMRLYAGALAGKSGEYTLTGDESLSSRPMDRVKFPLEEMGASVKTYCGHAPVKIVGKRLSPAAVTLEIPSAQIKSALLLAALDTDGESRITEKIPSRDHTERILKAMNANIEKKGDTLIVRGGKKLNSVDIGVTGDISSAAYPLALGAGSGGEVTVKNVGINPTRTGIVELMERMGATVSVTDRREGIEPSSNITISGRVKNAVTVTASEIPRIIDELPLAAVLMALCFGKSRVTGAGELRNKESDRIRATVRMLNALGVRAEEEEGGFTVFGEGVIVGGNVDSCGDHRMAMTGAVALALSERGGSLSGVEAVKISYPEFFREVFLLK